MNVGIIFVRCVFFLTCSGFLLASIFQLYKRKSKMHYLCILLLYLFMVFPVFYQTIFPYEYRSFAEANAALNDLFTNIVYCVFVVALIVFLYFFARKSKPKKVVKSNPYIVNTCCLIITFSLLITIFTNGIGILFSGFGARLIESKFEIYEPLVGCSIISYLCLVFQWKSIKLSNKIYTSFFMLILLWIHGKRSVMAIVLVMILFSLVMRGKIYGKKMLFYFSMSFVVILGFSFLYGVVFKKNVSVLSDYLAIDMSRHYTLMYQIYCFKIGKEISVHGLDSISAILLFWVPRSLWEAKPYPFCNSLTRSLLSLTPANVNLGWSTTVTIFSDLFDSFSFFGLFFGALLVNYVCKKMDGCRRPEYVSLLMYFLIHLVTVQLVPSLICLSICLAVFVFMNKTFHRNQSVLYRYSFFKAN